MPPGGGRHGIGIDKLVQPGGVDDKDSRSGRQMNTQARRRQRATVLIQPADEGSAAQFAELGVRRLDRGRTFEQYKTMSAGAVLSGERDTGRQDRLGAGWLKRLPRGGVRYGSGWSRAHCLVLQERRYKTMTQRGVSRGLLPGLSRVAPACPREPLGTGQFGMRG
jgi:hypothetical protein